MPAFGCNRFTIPFIENVFQRMVVVSGDGSEEDPFVYEHAGFRLSDRIVGALDRFLGQVIGRLASAAYPGLSRFAYIYPFVGATDWTHSMNLADTDGGYARYSIIWGGAVAHSANGILGGTGNTQAEGGWVTGPQYENWVYKSFGFYSRTNNAGTEKSMSASASNTNGYTYYQGIHPRFTDGNAYFDNCLYTGPSTGGNRVSVAVADSLGLFGCSRESGTLLRCFKRGVQIGYDNVNPAQGLGAQGGGVMVVYPTNRNLSFVFATKHNCFLSYDEYLAFADMVQRLQAGLNRAV